MGPLPSDLALWSPTWVPQPSRTHGPLPHLRSAGGWRVGPHGSSACSGPALELQTVVQEHARASVTGASPHPAGLPGEIVVSPLWPVALLCLATRCHIGERHPLTLGAHPKPTGEAGPQAVRCLVRAATQADRGPMKSRWSYSPVIGQGSVGHGILQRSQGRP